MMTTSRPSDSDRDPALLLFDGPGEMRALCRDFDWSATGLGTVDRWPLSLRTTVATLLASRHPMFLFWGRELVQFYNDAYRPSLGSGDRHPAALGMRATDFWKEIWDVIGPQIEHVMAGGDATWHEDQYLPIERNGSLEDVWWTYSYSPAFNDGGKVGGVLVVCQETTTRVQTQQHLEELTKSLSAEAGRFKELLDGSPAVMALFSGPHHVIKYVNPAWDRVVGKSGCLGLPVREVFPEMIESGIFNRLDEVYSSGEPATATEVALPLRREPDQPLETGYWNLAWIPVPGSSNAESFGGKLDILVHAVEVSEQVLARREVERLLDDSNKARQEAEQARNAVDDAERQFETLVDAIPTLAWTARADGYIDWYNARWYEYTGTTPEDMEGWGWTAVHDADALPVVLARWQKSIDSGKPFEMTFPLRGADGTFRPFLTRVVPLRDNKGDVVRWFGTNTDIELETGLRREAEAANRAKSEFLAVMSHELRTPLNAIDGYAELMELGIRGALTDEQREDLRRIRKSQRHLLGLINGVLNYSRVEAGAVRYAIEDVIVVDVLTTCEALVALQLRAKGLKFTFEGCDPLLVVRADGEKLQQIVLNLLTNAIKFTDAGGSVSLGCIAKGDDILITVTDTGRGIAPDQLVRVFEPFVQIDAQLTRTQDGVGLGLAISRDLARGMSGDLVAESTLSEGSAFTLCLPRNQYDRPVLKRG